MYIHLTAMETDKTEIMTDQLEEFHHFLYKLMAKKVISQSELAEKLNFSRSYISQLLSGEKKAPRPVKMEQLAQALDCNKEEYDALMNYAYQRALGTNYSLDRQVHIDAARVNFIPIIEWDYLDKLDFTQSALPLDGVGVVDDVATEFKNKNLFALIVHDDSMEPEFKVGDTIIVDPHAKVTDNDFVIIKVKNDQPVLRKWNRVDVLNLLHPLNPDYKDLIFKDSECKLIGRVIGSQVRY